MSVDDTMTVRGYRPPAGEESGTAPSDRRFRPDVEGLRAIAILTVVLYHAGVPGMDGGYIGVDVFFVISGFVITGLLLRERARTDGTSILDFYARRCRRILPAATLTILITVLAAFVVLGVVNSNNVADDGRWAAIFLSNFHFASVGTDYFASALPPSPLQNFWSLSVEEQFYIVFPTLFLVVASLKSRFELRTRLSAVLIVVIGLSYWLSIAQTSSDPLSAYFSPFTRAWELALGALVAVCTPLLQTVPRRIAVAASWAGLIAIGVATTAFTATTAYPGSLVAVPVVGAALVIAGGTVFPSRGAESLLGLGPFQWLGRRSYSLYLWHWPILIIVAEQIGKTTLPVGENLLLLVAAMGVSIVSYAVVENPIRHLRFPSTWTVLAGIVVIAATVAVLTLAMTGTTGRFSVTPATNSIAVIHNVEAATHIKSIPASVEPPLADAPADRGQKTAGFTCAAAFQQSSVPICKLGDRQGSQLMVLYGDSHALMWIPALNDLALKAHWRLVVLGKSACPAGLVTTVNPPGYGAKNSAFVACNAWHRWAVSWINQHKPNMLVTTQRSLYAQPASSKGASTLISAKTWKVGLEKLFDDVHVANLKTAVIGNTPTGGKLSPSCLSINPQSVQTCSRPVTKATAPKYLAAEKSAATSVGATYIDPTPWFCSQTCTSIIGNVIVFSDNQHITATYARYLENALGQSIGFPPAP